MAARLISASGSTDAIKVNGLGLNAAALRESSSRYRLGSSSEDGFIVQVHEAAQGNQNGPVCV